MARERVVKLANTASDYPERVRAAIPEAPTLETIGPLDLLHQDAIGICGSRDATPEALHHARRFGQKCAELGLVLVSGYARGVDRQAHKGVLEAGGKTIAALPEGMAGFRILRELEPLIDVERNFLAVSMFETDARWTSWRAMNRNKLIVGLSLGMFVVEAREKGGTIDAANECVRQGKPLWAIKYANENTDRSGNKVLLVQEKAVPLKSVADFAAALHEARNHSLTRTGQIPLPV